MNLKEKLSKVMADCSHISRDAINDEGGYPYVSAAKINDTVNRALTKYGVTTVAETKIADIRTIDSKIFAAVEVKITLYDTDSDEKLTIIGAGTGIDTSDKSVAKAQTMAIKYAWKNSLLIADSADDPDATAGKVQYKSASKINVPF